MPLHGPYVMTPHTSDDDDSGEEEEEEERGATTHRRRGPPLNSLGAVLPTLQMTTVATHNVAKTGNVFVSSADRNLFLEPLYDFRVHFGSHRSEIGGCSVERRMRNVTRVRCAEVVFPIHHEVFTTLPRAETVRIAQYPRLHLFLDPMARSRDEIGATGQAMQDAYQIMVPRVRMKSSEVTAAEHFVQFIPSDTATNHLETPVNLQSMQVRVEPSAWHHDMLVREEVPRLRTGRALQLPTLDLYAFSALVYDRATHTLTATFATPLDTRLVKVGHVLTFARVTFDDCAAYENYCEALQWWIDQQHHFAVVGVTLTDDEMSVDSVQLHFEFTTVQIAEFNLQHAVASFDLDTQEDERNVMLNHALQYQMRVEVDYLAPTLTTVHAEPPPRHPSSTTVATTNYGIE